MTFEVKVSNGMDPCHETLLAKKGGKNHLLYTYHMVIPPVRHAGNRLEVLIDMSHATLLG